jgi:lantibiotic leader peptide-processing serine protease
MKRIILLLAVLALLVSPSASTTMAQGETTRWVVNFSGNSLPNNAGANIAAAGGQLVRAFPQVGVAIAESSNPNFATTMKGFPRVHSVGEVGVISVPEVQVVPAELDPQAFPDPPAAFWNLLWGIARVNAPAAWEVGITGSHDTVVAVIDTGIASNHPDVGPNLVFNACYVSTGDHTTGACTPYPSLSFHGTHVAGTVAANFGGGVVGVGPNLGLANYNVFELFPDGSVRAFFDSVWTAMMDAADQDFDVINMSLGALGSFRGPDGAAATFTANQRVANYVRQQGTYIVASAGNAALDLNGPIFNVPGGVPGITNVGATGIRPDAVFPQPDAFDVLAFYSNYGAAVPLVAPGGDCGLPDSCDPATRPANWFEYLVLSAFVAPAPACAETQSCPVGWAWAGGTSMAAPHVSGVAGLVRDQNPSLNPNQVETILFLTAENLGDYQLFGHGMVNAYAASTQR